MKSKFIHTLYEVVIYVFPILLLFFILVGFQLWKLEGAKKDMVKRLHNSNEIIAAARSELQSIRVGVSAITDSFTTYVYDDKTITDIYNSFPKSINKQLLVELSMNVMKRVTELKSDSIDYRQKNYVITSPTGKYYAVIISYSELGYAIIQREHLMSLGFNNIKILETDKHYAISIDEANSKTDFHLNRALDNWNAIYKSKSDAYIKQF
jgi:hypothetical protein